MATNLASEIMMHRSHRLLSTMIGLLALTPLLGAVGCGEPDPVATARCQSKTRSKCAYCCTSNGAKGSSWASIGGCTCRK